MPIRAILGTLLLSLLPCAAAAQAPDGQLSGTLDCPARSIFESGSTPVRGTIRGGEVRVTLPDLVVSGRVLPVNLGVTAVQISGQAARHSASFTGVLTQAGTLHARGVVDERPCNLNLTLSAAAPGQVPTPTPVPTQPAGAPRAAGAASFEGPWAGTVNCPSRSFFDSGEVQVRGVVRDNVVSLQFGEMRVQGVIIGVSPTPLLRLEGGGARGGAASFDGLVVTPDRIHARGLVNEQPCNVNITPVRAVPGPAIQAQPQPVQPGPDKQPTPSFVAPTPPPPPREPEPRPPVASTRPTTTPTPTPAPQRPAAPSAADRLACALAGTCPQPASPPGR